MYNLVVKQRIIKILVVLLVVAGITTAAFFIFRAMGLTTQKGFQDFLDDLGAWKYVIFIIIFILQAVFLSFLPGNTTISVTAAFFLFKQNFLLTLGVCMVAFWIASIILYLLGRYGGRKLLHWMFGRKAIDGKLEWISRQGTKVVPWLYLFPFMTGDLLCIICGSSKMNFWQYLLIIIVFRTVECALIISYSVFFPILFKTLQLYEILIIANLVIIDIVLLAIYHKTILKLFRKTFAPKKYAKQCAEEQERKGFLRAFRWRRRSAIQSEPQPPQPPEIPEAENTEKKQ